MGNAESVVTVERRDYILAVECAEPSGKVVRYVRPLALSFENMHFLWQKLSQFDSLFGDDFDGTFESFADNFIRTGRDGRVIPTGLFWLVDDVGIFYVTDMIPNASASAHFTFWDGRLRGREELIKEMIRWTFRNLEFHRIEVRVPLYARKTFNAVERVGFKKEGRLRQAIKYKGSWFDVNVYSLLSSEV